MFLRGFRCFHCLLLPFRKSVSRVSQLASTTRASYPFSRPFTQCIRPSENVHSPAVSQSALVDDSVENPIFPPQDFFNYTSGRWIYNEAQQLRSRRITFSIPALKEIAAKSVGARMYSYD